MDAFLDRVFSLSQAVRYVAIYHRGQLASAMRPNLKHPSESESDKYEELLVNPTLLKLATQRGNIDCGGLDYLILRYGSFFELVVPMADGHLSVGIEPESDPLSLVAGVKTIAGEIR